jgi:hypothetical protein
MPSDAPYHIGNAASDSVGGTGWFVGQFVPAALGLRHQDDVELKWGIHPQGEGRPGGVEANGVATTISILLQGDMHITFTVDGMTHDVRLRRVGDYVIFGPDLAHGWTALADSVVLSVRFPSVDRRGAAATARSAQAVHPPR